MRCRTGTLPNRLATVPRVCVSGKTGHLIRSYRRNSNWMLVPPPVPLKDRTRVLRAVRDLPAHARSSRRHRRLTLNSESLM